MTTVATKDYGELLRIRARHGRGSWVHLELRGASRLYRAALAVAGTDAAARCLDAPDVEPALSHALTLLRRLMS